VFLSVLFVFVFLVFVFCLARWQLNGLCIDPFQFSFVSHCHYDQCCYCINSVNLHNAIVFPAW
jgi:predicted DNA-binding helix-hairpin-helix protein